MLFKHVNATSTSKLGPCQTDCVVIGAGIAGVTSARAMVEAGRPGMPM